MKQVKDGRIVRHTLPVNGFLSNGQAVSGYKNLPVEVLEKEGWVEPETVKPILTKDQMLGSVKFEVKDGKVMETFEVLEKPTVVAPEADPLELIKQRLDAIEGKVLTEIKG